MNEFFGICIRKQLYTHVHSHTNRMLAITRHTQKEHIQISMDLIRPTFLYRVASLTIFTCLYCTKVSLDHFVIFLLLLVIDIHTLYCIYVYKQPLKFSLSIFLFGVCQNCNNFSCITALHAKLVFGNIVFFSAINHHYNSR